MFIQTWLPPIFASSHRDRHRVPLRSLPRVDHGRKIPALAGLRLVRKTPGQRPAGLEAVCRRPAGLQYRAVRVRLCGAGAPEVDAAESRRQGDALPQHHLSGRDLVHDEHGPPALGRRPAPVELQPDFLLPSPCSSYRPPSDSPRWWRSSGPCAAIPRSATISSTCGGYWSTCSCRSPLSSLSSLWCRAAR